MSKREKIAEHISNMRAEDVIEMWGDYCRKNKWHDDVYFDMPFFDSAYSEKSPLEIAKLVYKQDFNPDAEYWKDGVWGVTSFATAQDCVDDMDIDAMVKYIVNHDDWLYNEDIQEILTDEEEEE